MSFCHSVKSSRSLLRLSFSLALLALPLLASAQIGKHRNTFSIGANAGAVLSNVGFDPEVSQKQHVGFTGGFSWRYTSEKYFSTICSIAGEVNIASIGWKEDILDLNDNPVINSIAHPSSIHGHLTTYRYLFSPILHGERRTKDSTSLSRLVLK